MSLLHDRCEALILVSPQLPEAQRTALGQRTPTIVITTIAPTLRAWRLATP